VVFIGYEDKTNGEFVATGTGFFVGRDLIDGRIATYIVTAEHNIQKIRDQGALDVLIRLNLRAGGAKNIPIAHGLWTRNTRKADVAVIQLAIDEEMDHLCFPLKSFVSKESIVEENIGVGSEVSITGLFKPHNGWTKNVPIIRVGVIAAMDEEEVSTNEHGRISAYLIEARSIGGLSGSPVMVHSPPVRIKDGHTEIAKTTGFFLLGLVHAHFDVDESKVDAAVGRGRDQINMGIAIVVPWYDILETLNSPHLLKHEGDMKSAMSFEKARREQMEALNKQLKSERSDNNCFPSQSCCFRAGTIIFSGLGVEQIGHLTTGKRAAVGKQDSD